MYQELYMCIYVNNQRGIPHMPESIFPDKARA